MDDPRQVAGMTPLETDELAKVREALNYHTVRITVSVGLTMSGSITTARVEIQEGGGRKWKQQGPLLMPAAGKNRADLLRLLADLVEVEGDELGAGDGDTAAGGGDSPDRVPPGNG